MENLKMHTPDLATENYKKLAALFPNAVTETVNEKGEVVRAIDADVLRQEISASVVEGFQERYLAGKHVFSVADGYLIACFDNDVTEETVTEIAKQQPYYAVFRDSSMANDSVATNFEQIFATYSPKTQRKVL